MISEREKELLWKRLSFDIHRYLMANTFGREDGYEKAEKHIKISKEIAAFLLILPIDDIDIEVEIWMFVHDYLADILTNKMDEVIGFPIDKPLYGNDYNILAKKFFDVIIENLGNIEVLLNKLGAKNV